MKNEWNYLYIRLGLLTVDSNLMILDSIHSAIQYGGGQHLRIGNLVYGEH